MSSFNITPFHDIQNTFAAQVSSFDNLATNGFATPSMVSVIPATSLGTPSGGIGGIAPGGGLSLPGIVGSAGSAALGAAGSAIFSSRVVAILLGLIFIAGAIFLFGADELFGSSTVKNIIKTGAATAA